jgi:NDP-4-keto-2,6-dideoxyhexose 3-C-methyltransferase
MKKNYESLSHCRICKNTNLVEVLDLGDQYLSGVFPRSAESTHLTKGPLKLVECQGGEEACGLVQLAHNYDVRELFGDNYGYRTGLNTSMVMHLQSKIREIMDRVKLSLGDLVIDIGSSDGTSLKTYPNFVTRVGIDPVGMKFQKYYPPGITLIPKLFSFDLLDEQFQGRKAKIITSFSMLYDLENPQSFVCDIARLLDQEYGLWVFEQSYLPTMINKVAFDTICHEHIEYYKLRQIEWMLDKVGMRIVDVDFNEVNGGSFSVVAAHRGVIYPSSLHKIYKILQHENAQGLDDFGNFRVRVDNACSELKSFLAKAKGEGKRVCGLGASTKGNVLLQYCNLTDNDIEVIGEINPDKFGSLTPGTWIPIEDEKKVLNSKPDYLLVLPWHFRDNFLSNPAYKGQRLIFPLPKLEVVLL